MSGTGGFRVPVPTAEYMPMSEREEKRFLARIAFGGPNECWLWIGNLTTTGYGVVQVKRKTRRAHRVAYHYWVAPVGGEDVVDHLCRNPRCVNPAHLEPVSNAENLIRGNGNSGVNARKTVCIEGHPFSGDNLFIDSMGWRQCRQCRTRRYRDQHARRQEARRG